jgi:aryl-alcohol dehydrogenase-like predicted oxidoreductase
MVSPLGVGTNRWAQGKNDETVLQVFRSVIETGVNFFDTAEVYMRGRSERLLGKCLQRDHPPLVIASKFLPLPTRLTSRQFMNALNSSLKRLGIPILDLYYIHFPYTLLSVEKLMDLMAQAVEAGKIRAVGVSNFNANQMRRAATRLERYHIPLAANQVRYNLVHRQPEKDGVLDLCRELNVALVAYRPLERGKLISNTIPKEQTLQETLQTIAQQHQKSISQIALNWLLRRDEHIIPIPGTTNPRHALENTDTLSWELSPNEVAAIDQASQHPVD